MKRTEKRGRKPDKNSSLAAVQEFHLWILPAVLELRSDFGLFSKEDEQGERMLVYCDLPFAEDRRELVFRSLIDRKHMPTEDQVSSASGQYSSVSVRDHNIE
jgi:hypothetical protein